MASPTAAEPAEQTGNGAAKDEELAQPAAFSQVGKNVKLDHLGVPIKARSANKFRYARTYTILYGSQKAKSIVAEKQWQLLQDARKVMDCSLAGLRNLFIIFSDAAKAQDESMVGPRTFKLALEKHNVRDGVMTRRLFTEFASKEQPNRIDFRNLLRVLATVNEEKIEDKLDLLFDVWDVDNSRTLSFNELSPNVFADLSTDEMAGAADQLNKTWKEIKDSLSDADGGDSWMAMSRANGITKEELVGAAESRPSVQLFFTKMLTRLPPKADERRTLSFETRLAELQAEIIEETKKAEDALRGGQDSQAELLSRSMSLSNLDDGDEDSPMLKRRGTLKRRKTVPRLGVGKELDKYKEQAEAAMKRMGTGLKAVNNPVPEASAGAAWRRSSLVVRSVRLPALPQQQRKAALPSRR